MSGVKIVLATLLVLFASGGCGGTPPVTVAPSTTAAPSALRTSTATPATPTVPPGSPTPKPSPLTSAKGAITVTSPLSGEQVGSPVTVAGSASVFEATVAWRVITASGTVLAQGNVIASAGAPQRGTFSTNVSFALPYYGEPGFVEVFEVSPKDGSVSDIVRVPVAIQGSY